MSDTAYGCWQLTDNWGRSIIIKGMTYVTYALGLPPGARIARQGSNARYRWRYIGGMTRDEVWEFRERQYRMEAARPTERYL